ncbi:unnamed protein product [Amaranthus hypochondriacus]
MSDNPFERVKGGRLTFKGGVSAIASGSKAIDKKKKKKKNKHQSDVDVLEQPTDSPSGELIYTIDAAKKMKYEELFPVEAKKFGYDPKAKSTSSISVEQALDDRVKKKADRYCK